MCKKIILPIYDDKPNPFAKFIGKLWVCGLVGAVLNIFLLNSILVTYVTIAIIILTSIVMGFLQTDERVGDIILTESKINLNNKEIISIKDVKDLKIIISGHEGRIGLDTLRSIYGDDGKNNFIEFMNNNSYKKIRILVSSKNYEALIKLGETWKKNGLNCQLIF